MAIQKSLDKAIKFDKFGSSDVLELTEVSKPVLSRVQNILIKVISIGINPIDMKIREGSSFVSQSLTLPSGLGFDVCGEIVDIGNSISKFQVGDIILGKIEDYTKPASYAEFCVVNESNIIYKPKDLNSEQPGALPTAGFTAWQALHKHGKVKSGERVLIHAGAGGVGHLAIQIALLSGAYVITTASKKHHQFLNKLGVNEIIDYREVPFNSVVKNIDLVIDLVGGEVGVQSIDTLNSTGRIITVPTITRDLILEAASKKNILASGMLAENNKKYLTDLAKLIADDKITVLVSKSFPLSQAKEAHDLLGTKSVQGEIVLTV
ncbi:MAG: NADPH2:quinone reductase [Francisellaceae bacterium]